MLSVKRQGVVKNATADLAFASNQPWLRVMLPLCFVDDIQPGAWSTPDTEATKESSECLNELTENSVDLEHQTQWLNWMLQNQR